MVLEAASHFNIDLVNSIIVGDRLSDLVCGKRAGIKKFVHVLTGHGFKERSLILNEFINLNIGKNLFLVDNLNYFPYKDFLNRI